MLEFMFLGAFVTLLFCSLGYSVYSISQMIEKVNSISENYEDN